MVKLKKSRGEVFAKKPGVCFTLSFCGWWKSISGVGQRQIRQQLHFPCSIFHVHPSKFSFHSCLRCKRVRSRLIMSLLTDAKNVTTTTPNKISVQGNKDSRTFWQYGAEKAPTVSKIVTSRTLWTYIVTIKYKFAPRMLPRFVGKSWVPVQLNCFEGVNRFPHCSFWLPKLWSDLGRRVQETLCVRLNLELFLINISKTEYHFALFLTRDQ